MITVNLIGNLVDNAKLVESTNGSFVAFRLAVNFIHKGENGTLYVECSGNMVNAMQYLTKGAQVYVAGHASFYTYCDGNKEIHIGSRVRMSTLHLI